MSKPFPSSASPFIKKDKYFFSPLPHNSSTSFEESYSEEKQTQPFKSANSKLVTRPSLQLYRTTSNVSTLVQKISDVFDKTQISDAVSKATNKIERLKVVDFVLKQRNQIKETENRVRLERVAPLIKNFRKSFQTKSKNEIPKTNKFRETIRQAREEDELSSFPTSGNVPSFVRFDESPNANLAHEKRINADIESLFKNSGTEMNSERSNQKDQLFKPLHIQLEKIYPKEETKKLSQNDIQTSNPNFERKGGRQNFRTSILECRRKSLTPSNISKAHIIETFKNLFVKKDKSREEEKSAFLKPKRSKPMRKTIIKSIQDEANATLEEDIYKHLLKSGEQDSYNLRSFRHGNISKVKAIESRALSKFNEVKKQQRNLQIPEKSMKPFRIKSLNEKKSSYL